MAPCGCQLRDGGARHGADAPDRAPHRDTAHAVEAAGMTFLAPIFFYVGLGVAVAAVGLHLIVTRQPLSGLLPTVRFVPPSAVRVTTVVPVPEDRLLLALRVLLALAIGAAFARPVIVPRRRSVARVVVADVSRAVGDIGGDRKSTRLNSSHGYISY